jgi:PAS domain S-box-containing protein
VGKLKAWSTSSASREQEILDTLAVAICAWDVGSTITFWNAGAEQLYGWSQDEAIGRNLLDLLKCEYGEPLSDREAQLFETGAWHGRSFRHAKDGSLLIVDTGWSLRRDVAGAPVEIIEAARRTDTIQAADQNSAELMDAYHALAESEKKYRDLFNFMPIAIWQLDTRKMRAMVDDLRAAGVENLAAHMSEHPEFLDQAQASLKVTEANERTLALFGATDRRKLLEAMPGLWLTGPEDWAAGGDD